MSEPEGAAANEPATPPADETATGPGANSSGPEPFRLPRRPPKPLATHILIDGLVAAIVIGIPGFIAGIPLWALISVGGFIGIAAAPFTRRAEINALAKRPERIAPGTLPNISSPTSVTGTQPRAPRPIEIDPTVAPPAADPPEGGTP